MEEETFIIEDCESGDHYTGSGWSPEYPDAQVYATSREAEAAIRKLRVPFATRIVRNLGFENESTELWIEGQAVRS